MRAAIADVVTFDLRGNGGAGFGEAAEVVQPDTLLFETAEEALDETILLGRIGRLNSWRNR
jgi:hypothetical protein